MPSHYTKFCDSLSSVSQKALASLSLEPSSNGIFSLLEHHISGMPMPWDANENAVHSFHLTMTKVLRNMRMFLWTYFALLRPCISLNSSTNNK